MEYASFHSVDGQTIRVQTIAKGPCQHKGFEAIGLMSGDDDAPHLACTECGSRFTVREAELWTGRAWSRA